MTKSEQYDTSQKPVTNENMNPFYKREVGMRIMELGYRSYASTLAIQIAKQIKDRCSPNEKIMATGLMNSSRRVGPVSTCIRKMHMHVLCVARGKKRDI